LDEEALAATLDIFGRAFLRLAPQYMFDTAAMAHAAGEVVAIANTFVSQPWKQVYHWAPWAVSWWCEVGGQGRYSCTLDALREGDGEPEEREEGGHKLAGRDDNKLIR
jgi:hypothetical protein